MKIILYYKYYLYTHF